jgi:hypothetical protein
VVAEATLATSRGMVAGIMALVLRLALLEILFGGTHLRTRLMFGRKVPARRYGRADRVAVPSRRGSSMPGPHHFVFQLCRRPYGEGPHQSAWLLLDLGL